MTSPLTLATAPRLQAFSSGGLSASPAKDARHAKARAQGEEFEAAFLNSMFQHMYAGIHGDGPFGDSTGVGTWRSFLTEQYAKNFVKAGGIGLANQVYQSLLAHQEARAK